MIKVLHIWNTAGVASLMVKHLNKNGFKSDVIMREGYDPFGMSEYYNHKLLNLSGGQFIKYAIDRSSEYDIIHIHGIWKLAEPIKKKYPNKKVILQHHGTELTNCINNSERINSYQYCDKVLCSTVDLSVRLNYDRIEHEVLENAVDTDLFKPIDNIKIDKALLFSIRYTDLELTKEFVKSNTDWNTHIIDREKEFIKYSGMPYLFSKFTKYVDVKIYEWLNNKPGEAYSKTGREALACGLEVLNYKGEIVKGLPEEYTPEFMVNKLIRIYSELL